MYLSDKWSDYRLVDCAAGEKLEYWGKYLLRRPDPQAIWSGKYEKQLWNKADACYHRSSSGGGRWEFMNKNFPSSFVINYGEYHFRVKPTGFKHTGLFPEQAVNWDWFAPLIKAESAKRSIKVLNLFAYTGGATIAALGAGAAVCHVDASKGMVTWAHENVDESALGDKPVRYITDDVVKFVKREIRRKNKYDGVIMDPPSYGRGPAGEMWKAEKDLYPLIEDCVELLSDDPLFFLINSYTTGFGPTVIENVMKMTVAKKFGGSPTADEIGIPVGSRGIILPCGVSGRWQKSE